MYCLKCGTKLSEEVKFCPKCGQKTSVESSEVTTGDTVSDNNIPSIIDIENNNFVAEKTTFFQRLKNKIAEFWYHLSMF